MVVQDFLDLANKVIKKEKLSHKQLRGIIDLPEDRVFDLLPGAGFIRETYFKNRIHLCVICNGKSGKCSEDCTFCAQSKYYETQIDTYPLLSEKDLQQDAKDLKDTPVNRYSIVTSGKGLSPGEIGTVCKAYKGIRDLKLSLCASLGILDTPSLEKLSDAGVSRYHHNLETARSHFDQICTTHTFDQRIDTIKAAKKAGMSICSGEIFGMGETFEQILEQALELRSLDVDAVPLNFLSPIPGTPLETTDQLTPLRCLKIIALFRFVLPDRQILICGGREANLGLLQPLIFFAGASGIMTGNYLTTNGQALENDLDMLEQLGLAPDNGGK